MEKYEDGIESRWVFLSTKTSRLCIQISIKEFKIPKLDILVDKNTLLDSIPSSDFSIFKIFY
eukprot:Pgem_evm1s1775